MSFVIRPAISADLPQLDQLEKNAFQSDRLSLRQFRYSLKPSAQRVFLVAMQDQLLLGYGLLHLHKGTRLARLYSLAVDQQQRGKGVGRRLIEALEQAAVHAGRLYMRLEVAENNQTAIQLYQSQGYSVFSWVPDYYEDHSTAMRMQKRIRVIDQRLLKNAVPWYQQTTDFTCGPAALMMAMASLKPDYRMLRAEELAIWREATTIYMTSGHDGCHPIGLGLSARQRGFKVEVIVNRKGTLFVDGVRSRHKKELITFVEQQFRRQAELEKMPVSYAEISQSDLQQWLSLGKVVVMLISTWRMDGRKAPHWVVVSAFDDQCFYLHDPDPDDDRFAFDCQYVPIARDDFDRMSTFGSRRLRTCVVLSVAED